MEISGSENPASEPRKFEGESCVHAKSIRVAEDVNGWRAALAGGRRVARVTVMGWRLIGHRVVGRGRKCFLEVAGLPFRETWGIRRAVAVRRHAVRQRRAV